MRVPSVCVCVCVCVHVCVCEVILPVRMEKQTSCTLLKHDISSLDRASSYLFESCKSKNFRHRNLHILGVTKIKL